MTTCETLHIDHNEYQKKVVWMSDNELRWTIEDAKKAIEAMPNNPKCGIYQDEINYCTMEIARRTKAHYTNITKRLKKKEFVCLECGKTFSKPVGRCSKCHGVDIDVNI